MRNILLTLFLALAVFFGSTHAYAITHDHDAHSASALSQPISGEQDSDDQSAADSKGKEVAHGHSAMDAAPDSLGVGFQYFKAASVMPIREVMALPSLGIAPPLEPPSA